MSRKLPSDAPQRQEAPTQPGGVQTAVNEPELTFRGLDYCDSCGAELRLGEWLSGLCEACRGPAARGRVEAGG